WSSDVCSSDLEQCRRKLRSGKSQTGVSKSRHCGLQGIQERGEPNRTGIIGLFGDCLFFFEDVDYLLNRSYSCDRLLGKGHGKSDGSHQLAVDVHRTAAHALKYARRLDRSAPEPG